MTLFDALIGRALVGLAAAALAGPQAAAARPLDDVTSSGYLRIAVYKEFEPFAFEQDGRLKGIDVEIGIALAKALNLKPRFMRLQADENVDDDLRNAVWKGHYLGGGVADVMMHVPVDPEVRRRNILVVIFGRYFTERMAIAADPAKVKNVITLSPFVDQKVGAEIDTLSSFYLASALSGQLRDNLVRFLSVAKAVEALKNREIAGFMATKSQADWAASVAGPPIHVVQPSMPGLMIKNWDIGVAVKHDSRDLGYALGDEISKLKISGQLKEIFGKYGVRYNAEFLD